MVYRVKKFFASRRPNKYKANRCEYGGGMYHSKRERQYAFELDLRKKSGDIKDWDRQKIISLDLAGKHICNYIIDFIITHNDDTLEYVEVKGFETPEWRLKWKMFEALFGDLPNVRLTIVR